MGFLYMRNPELETDGLVSLTEESPLMILASPKREISESMSGLSWNVSYEKVGTGFALRVTKLKIRKKKGEKNQRTENVAIIGEKCFEFL